MSVLDPNGNPLNVAKGLRVQADEVLVVLLDPKRSTSQMAAMLVQELEKTMPGRYVVIMADNVSFAKVKGTALDT